MMSDIASVNHYLVKKIINPSLDVSQYFFLYIHSNSSLPFDTLPIADYTGSTDEEGSDVKEETGRRKVENSSSDFKIQNSID